MVRADDEVVDAVAVDIAGSAQRVTGIVGRCDAVQDEALTAVAAVGGQQILGVERLRIAVIASEHDEGLAGVIANSWTGAWRADGEVVEAVPVQVADPAHRPTTRIAVREGLED